MSTMADRKTGRTRRSFTEDYKAGAVRLVLDEGKTVAAVARDLGLTESSLRNWVEHARADQSKGKTGLTTAEREERAPPQGIADRSRGARNPEKSDGVSGIRVGALGTALRRPGTPARRAL